MEIITNKVSKMSECALDELHIMQGNLKSLSKENYKKLTRSMIESGFASPFIIWIDGNGKKQVLDGTQRLKALKLMKDDGQQIPSKFPCVEILAKDKKDAAKILSGLASAYGVITDESLSDFVIDMGLDFDFIKDVVAFPDLKFDSVGFGPQNQGLCDEDEVPDAPKTTNIKRGDIWSLGNHRLMCGDSTSIDAVHKLLNGEKADMVFTDPPYGMNLDTDYRSMGSKNKFDRIIGDGDDFKPALIQTLLGVFSYCSEIFLFGADYYAELINDRNSGSWVVWDKRSHGDNNIGTLDGSFGADFELCWSKSKHQRKMCRVIRNKGAFIKRREGVDTMHPSQKPVEMVEWFFNNWAKDLTNIVDLFGGSGSTLIACEKTNRKCFMMEIDPIYCQVIIDRWEKYTGKKAKLVESVKK